MTGKPVNLRQARKARDRSERRAAADANATLHGRSKAQRRAEEQAKTRDAAQLDGKKLDR